MENLFLTEIAKDYIPGACVLLDELPVNYYGTISKAHTIVIDVKKLHCVPKIMFSLFHEIGHYVLGHFYREKSGVIEEEANAWAEEKLSFKSEYRRSNSAYRCCVECIRSGHLQYSGDTFFCKRAGCFLPCKNSLDF